MSAPSSPRVNVPCSLDREQARRRAERLQPARWLRRAGRALSGWRSGFPERQLPWLELLALPVWRMIPRSAASRRTDESETAVDELQLCALSGRPWALPRTEATCRLSATAVAPRIGEVEASSRARSLIQAARRRGGDLELSAELAHRGCWLWIWERRRGKLDVLLVDALEGDRIGGVIRSTLLGHGLPPPRDPPQPPRTPPPSGLA